MRLLSEGGKYYTEGFESLKMHQESNRYIQEISYKFFCVSSSQLHISLFICQYFFFLLILILKWYFISESSFPFLPPCEFFLPLSNCTELFTFLEGFCLNSVASCFIHSLHFLMVLALCWVLQGLREITQFLCL